MNPSVSTVIVIVVLVAAGALVARVWLAWSRDTRQSNEFMRQQLDVMREQMATLSQSVLVGQNQGLTQMQDAQKTLSSLLTERLETTAATMHRQLDAVPQIQKKLGELEEQARSIAQVGRDIGALSDLLKPPKIRGGVGEMMLQKLLADILPRSAYETEYSFRSGERVDAVVRFEKTLLPIDSKWPKETFERMTAVDGDPSLRKQFDREMRGHIDKVARYIKPEEGCANYALLYLPSESVFGAATGIPDGGASLFEYAYEKRVMLTCPSIMYFHLATIAYALRSFEMSRQGEEILKRIVTIRDAHDKFLDDFSKLGTNLKNAGANYDSADKRARRIAGDLEGASRGMIDEGPPVEHRTLTIRQTDSAMAFEPER